jgi:hypothetical protein
LRRWLVLASPFGFMVSVVFENEVWRQRTRRFRAWLGVVALAWCNGDA